MGPPQSSGLSILNRDNEPVAMGLMREVRFAARCRYLSRQRTRRDGIDAPGPRHPRNAARGQCRDNEPVAMGLMLAS